MSEKEYRAMYQWILWWKKFELNERVTIFLVFLTFIFGFLPVEIHPATGNYSGEVEVGFLEFTNPPDYAMKYYKSIGSPHTKFYERIIFWFYLLNLIVLFWGAIKKGKYLIKREYLALLLFVPYIYYIITYRGMTIEYLGRYYFEEGFYLSLICIVLLNFNKFSNKLFLNICNRILKWANK